MRVFCGILRQFVGLPFLLELRGVSPSPLVFSGLTPHTSNNERAQGFGVDPEDTTAQQQKVDVFHQIGEMSDLINKKPRLLIEILVGVPFEKDTSPRIQAKKENTKPYL